MCRIPLLGETPLQYHVTIHQTALSIADLNAMLRTPYIQGSTNSVISSSMSNQKTRHTSAKKNILVRRVFYLLGYNTVHSVESQRTFLRKIWPPSSGSKSKLTEKPACSSQKTYYVAFSSVVMMEAIFNSETSVAFHRTTRYYIPED
jgi:hypothetical protein